MFEAITIDAVRLFREFATTKFAELLAAVNAKAAEVVAAINGQGIKSVQRGVLTMIGSMDVAISAVNMNKAELRLVGWRPGSNSQLDTAAIPIIYLSTGSTVRVERGGSSGYVIVSWELTEWK